MASINSFESLPALLTTKQAAKILQCHEKTVCRMCQDGELQAVRVRTLWRINRDALLAFACIGDK